MPIKKTTKGYKFGESGKEYPNKAGAVEQMKAMYASGYTGRPKARKKTTKRPKK